MKITFCTMVMWLGTSLVVPHLLAEETALDARRPSMEVQLTTEGTIQGQIVWEGAVPPPQFHRITKDLDALGDRMADESLLIDAESKGIRNFLIWIDRLDHWPRSIAEEVQEEASQRNEPREVKIVIRKGAFQPYFTLARKGDLLMIENTDRIGHNAKLEWRRNPNVGETVAGNGLQQYLPTESEPFPVQIRCTIHAHMSALVMVSAHQFVTLSDAQGRFNIPRVPAGTHTICFWHEHMGSVGGRRLHFQQAEVTEGDLGTLRFGPEATPAPLP